MTEPAEKEPQRQLPIPGVLHRRLKVASATLGKKLKEVTVPALESLAGDLEREIASKQSVEVQG